MGYFGKQIYNEPMSMYVDPKLDVLANSLAAVQKRHDENYAQMGALDIMAHNIKVAPGDKAIKEAALGKLKAQRDAIAATGQYAYAMPQIGAATTDFMGNEDLNWSRDQEVKRQEALKQLGALGTAGLDFNKETQNWSSFDPITKERREYTNRVEKQEDYDGTAQEVMKVMANQRPIRLKPSHVRDYLVSGSITEVSEDDIKDYLDKGYNRFINGTKAGKQMYAKLTGIEDYTPQEAEQKIKLFLNDVGDAQIQYKIDENYQVDSAKLQREQMAQQERHWQAEQANKRAEAAAKAAKEGSSDNSQAALLIKNMKNGTSITDEQAAAWWTKASYEDNNGAKVDGYAVDGNIIIKPAKLGENFNPAVADKAQSFHQQLDNFNKRIKDLDWKLYAQMKQKGNLYTNITDPSIKVGGIYQNAALELVKEREAFIKNNQDKYESYQQYKKQIGGEEEFNKTVALGIALKRISGIANMASGDNMKAVDGKPVANINYKVKGSELKRHLGYYGDGGFDVDLGFEANKDSEAIKTLIKEGAIDLGDGEEIEDGRYYTIKAMTPVNMDMPQLSKFDEITAGSDTRYANNAERWKSQTTAALSESSALQTVNRSKSKFKHVGEEVVNNLYNNPAAANLDIYTRQVLANKVADILNDYQGESEQFLRERIDSEISKLLTGK